MDSVYFSFILFLFMLAVVDLIVGVSNDAVNFLNSAIGAKVARFRTVLIIASLGVFVGATMSNGMMDIARHGIFQPQMFSFNDLLCIFLAVTRPMPQNASIGRRDMKSSARSGCMVQSPSGLR